MLKTQNYAASTTSSDQKNPPKLFMSSWSSEKRDTVWIWPQNKKKTRMCSVFPFALWWQSHRLQMTGWTDRQVEGPDLHHGAGVAAWFAAVSDQEGAVSLPSEQRLRLRAVDVSKTPQTLIVVRKVLLILHHAVLAEGRRQGGRHVSRASHTHTHTHSPRQGRNGLTLSFYELKQLENNKVSTTKNKIQWKYFTPCLPWILSNTYKYSSTFLLSLRTHTQTQFVKSTGC